MERYEKLEKIREGTYGKVYKAKQKATGQLVALTKNRLEMGVEGFPPRSLREVSILQLLSQCHYVVNLLSVEHVDKTPKKRPDAGSQPRTKPVLYLVFEYLDTDLKMIIDIHYKGPKKSLPPLFIESILFQLCKGVAHCHSHGFVHCDLKPQNLLLDKDNGILKIADLGIRRTFTDPLWYRAPEVLLGSTHYSTAVDMWSVGCIFAEMANMTVLFPKDSQIEQLQAIFSLLGTPTEEQWPGVTSLRNWHDLLRWKPQNLAEAVPSLEPEGVDLLSRMLMLNPAQRISANTALDHPYFNCLDKSRF